MAAETPMKKLSPVQLEALRAIVEEHDRGVAEELKNWGEKSAASLASKAFVSLAYIRRPTWFALRDAGAIETTSEKRTYETLRRGAYGTWIGGSTTHSYADQRARPTDIGRAMLSQARKK